MLELLLVLKGGKGVAEAPRNGLGKRRLGRGCCHRGGAWGAAAGPRYRRCSGPGASVRWEKNPLDLPG